MLVVCGPSGAGKSTFLKQLASDLLQEHLRSQLPLGSERWQQIPAFKSEYFVEAREASDRSNVSLHYDLNNLTRYGGSGYADEPTAGIIGYAKSITIVAIKPSHDRLKAQLAFRCFGGSSTEETRALMLDKADSSNELRDKSYFLECYEQPGWLDAQSDLWDDYVGQLRHEGRLVKVITVTPTGALYAPSEYSWSLLGQL